MYNSQRNFLKSIAKVRSEEAERHYKRFLHASLLSAYSMKSSCVLPPSKSHGREMTQETRSADPIRRRRARACSDALLCSQGNAPSVHNPEHPTVFRLARSNLAR